MLFYKTQNITRFKGLIQSEFESLIELVRAIGIRRGDLNRVSNLFLNFEIHEVEFFFFF